MQSLSFLIYFLFFKVIFTLVSDEEVKEEFHIDRIYSKVDLKKIEKSKNFIVIKTDEKSPNRIYASIFKEKPGYKSSLFKAYQHGANCLYIPISAIPKDKETLFYSVEYISQSTNLQPKVNFEENIKIEVPKVVTLFHYENNTKFSVKGTKPYELVVLSSEINEIESISINDNNSFVKVFQNGYGYFGDNDITVTASKKGIMHLVVSVKEEQKEKKTLNIMEVEYELIKGEMTKCYDIKEKNSVVLNIQSYIPGLEVNIKAEERNESEIITETSYSKKLNPQNGITVCISINKDYANYSTIFGYILSLRLYQISKEQMRFLPPVTPGSIFRNEIESKSVMLHHVAPLTNQSSKYDLHVNHIKGKSILYGISCDNINIQCAVDYSEIESLLKSKIIVTSLQIESTTHVLMKTAGPDNEYAALVVCEDPEGCVYDIQIRVNSISLLPKKKIYFAPLENGDKIKYTFSKFNQTSNSVFIECMIFTGDITIQSSKVGGNLEPIKVNLQNRIFNSFTSNETTTVGEYNIVVESKVKSFYSLLWDENYSIKGEESHYVENGVLKSFRINPEEAKKKLIFSNKKKADEFLVRFKSDDTSNDLEIKAPNLAKENLGLYGKEYIVQSKDIREFAFYVSSNRQTVFSVLAYPLKKQQLIILQEGVTHKFNLTKLQDGYNLLFYPYWFTGYQRDFLLSIYGDVQMSYKIDSSENFSSPVIVESIKEVTLNSFEVEQKCFKGYLCPIFYNISMFNLTQNFSSYTIEITTLNQRPISLYLDTIISGKIFQGTKKYYYFDVTDDPGVINIAFTRGSGFPVARIVSKNVKEEGADWDGRVVLPNMDTTDRLPYDSYSGTITVNKGETNCTDSCELYLGIMSLETSLLYSSYTINFHPKFHSIEIGYFSNELYYGVFSSEQPTFTITPFLFFEEKRYVDFLVDCFDCEIKGNLKKFSLDAEGPEINFNLNNISRIVNISEEVGNITVGEINITRKNKFFFHKNYFFFKIPTPIARTLQDNQILYMKDVRQDFSCNFEECYYVFQVYDYDYLKRPILCSVKNGKKIPSKMGLKFIKPEEYNNYSTNNELLNHFPDATEVVNGTYAYTYRDEYIEEGYLLITFGKARDISPTLLVTTYNSPEKDYLLPNNRNLYSIVYNALELSMICEKYDNCLFEAFWVEGSGNIIFAKENSDTYLNQNFDEKNQHISFTINDNSNEFNTITFISNNNKRPFTFYTSYLKFGSKRNLLFLSHLDKENVYHYFLPFKDIFPFYFYVYKDEIEEEANGTYLINYQLLKTNENNENVLLNLNYNFSYSFAEDEQINDIYFSIKNYTLSLYSKFIGPFGTRMITLNITKQKESLLFSLNSENNQEHLGTKIVSSLLIANVERGHFIQKGKYIVGELQPSLPNNYIILTYTNYALIGVLTSNKTTIHINNGLHKANISDNLIEVFHSASEKIKLVDGNNKIKYIEIELTSSPAKEKEIKIKLTTNTEKSNYMIIYLSDEKRDFNNKYDLDLKTRVFDDSISFESFSDATINYIVSFTPKKEDKDKDKNNDNDLFKNLIYFSTNSTYVDYFTFEGKGTVKRELNEIKKGKYYVSLIGYILEKNAIVDIVAYSISDVEITNKINPILIFIGLSVLIILLIGSACFYLSRQKENTNEEEKLVEVKEVNNRSKGKIKILEASSLSE